jgi:hypothetical protein
MKSLLRRATICAALSCSLSLLLVAGASASTIKPVRVAATDQGDGIYVATATCPAGRHVVSGGFASPQNPSVVANHAVGTKAWTITAFDTDSISAVAYCSKYIKGVTESTATAPMDQVNDLQGGATASCPSGSRVIAGGWEYANPFDNSPIYTSMPASSSEWTVYGASDVTGNSITAYAYCLTNKLTTVRLGEKTSVNNTTVRAARRGGAGQSRGLLPSTQPSATVSCKKGETLFGGGYETTPLPDFNNQSGPDTFFGKSARYQGRGWMANAVNYSSYDGGEIQAFAVCRKAKS